VDRRSGKHLAVFDAANVVAHADQLSALGRAADRRDPGRRWVGQVADNMLQEWHKAPVVLRADLEFIGALLDSDTDVELVPDWTRRMPFDTLACSFPEPISLHDGTHLCHYTGFLATGVTSRDTSPPTGAVHDAPVSYGNVWTTYGPFSSHDGIRLLWTFHIDGNPTPQGQTVTVMLSGKYGAHGTLTQFIAGQRAYLEELGGTWGDELPTLVPLSVQLLLYLSATEPDLEVLAPGSYSRPQQLARADVAHVGWRVGAALRQYRQEVTGVREATPGNPAGWRLSPHIRKAHWHRVRVATRDEAGLVIGDRSGVEGVDWSYLLRWYPPTSVNMADGSSDAGAHPVVRSVAAEEPARSTPAATTSSPPADEGA
jgi:hypothetical protein